MSPLPVEAHCALHPEREVLETCARCGNFVCAVCMSSHAGRIVCVACMERSSSAGTSRRAVGAVVLSVLALALTGASAAVRQPLGCLVLPVSALGLGLGLVESAAIRSGASPAGGRRTAQLGTSLGALAIAAALALTFLGAR